MAADPKKKVKKPYEPQYFQKSPPGDETTYDFIQHRPTDHRTNIIESVGHLIKSCLGGGITAVNETYMKNGLWSSLGLNIILGISVTYCMLVLSRTAQKIYYRIHETTLSYPDLAQAVFDISKFAKLRPYARMARYAVDLTIMVDLFGSCACYMILIGESITDLAKVCEFPQAVQEINLRVWLAILILPCILITWILKLKYLAPFSIFGDVIIVCMTTMYYSLQHPNDPSKMPNYKDFRGFVGFIGGVVFAMEGVGVTLPVENHLQSPKQMWIVLWIGMSVVISLVMVNGFFGYLGWGDEADSPVTKNYPQSTFPIVLRVGLLIMVYITFALNFWVPFDLLWFYYKDKYPENRRTFIERVWRSCITLVIGLVAVAFPGINSLMSLLGSFCLSNMGFIFPALLELLVDWESPGLGYLKWRLWKAVGLTVFGTALFIIGTAINAYNLLEESYFKDTSSTGTTTPAGY